MPARVAKVVSQTVLTPVSGWRVIHWMATFVILWWAILFALPGDTFSLSPSYGYFRGMGTELEWSAAFGVCSIIGLVSGLTHCRWLKMTGCMVLSAAHGIIAVLLLMGSPLSTGSGTYAAIAVATTLRLWRLTKVTLQDG